MITQSEEYCKGVETLRAAIGTSEIEEILDLCATTEQCASVCKVGAPKDDIVKKMVQSIAKGEGKVQLTELDSWSGLGFLSSLEGYSGVSIIQEGQRYVACTPNGGATPGGLRDYIFRRRPSLAPLVSENVWKTLLSFLQTNLSESQCEIVRSTGTALPTRVEVKQPDKVIDTKSVVDNPAYYTLVPVYGKWVDGKITKDNENLIRTRALIDIDNIFGQSFLRFLDEMKVNRLLGISIAFDEFIINENMTLRLLYRVKAWYKKNKSKVPPPSYQGGDVQERDSQIGSSSLYGPSSVGKSDSGLSSPYGGKTTPIQYKPIPTGAVRGALDRKSVV